MDSVQINGVATFSTAGFGAISHDLNTSFKFYPNPNTNGILYIEPKTLDKGSVEIINILGSVVAHEEKENGIAKVKIDLSALNEGTYFVRYRTVDKMITEKLIITK
jgi:hypothetical protein